MYTTRIPILTRVFHSFQICQVIMEEVITLDVGGVRYKTTKSTLTKYPDSMLGNMFGGKFALIKQADGSIFIDRDGETFQFILDYLRSGNITLPSNDLQFKKLKLEADFYQIQPLVDIINSIESKKGSMIMIKSFFDANGIFRKIDIVGTQKVIDELIKLDSFKSTELAEDGDTIRYDDSTIKFDSLQEEDHRSLCYLFLNYYGDELDSYPQFGELEQLELLRLSMYTTLTKKGWTQQTSIENEGSKFLMGLQSYWEDVEPHENHHEAMATCKRMEYWCWSNPKE